MASVLVTGASGFVGAALIPRLLKRDAAVRAFGRDEARVRAAGVPASVGVVLGDATTGRGLDEALDGVEVAYWLVHSMEAAANGSFSDLERRSAEHFAAACAKAGVRRVVYLGGPVPADGAVSPHLASRVAVEEIMLGAAPQAAALRASIVIAARSRSFRFLVRLIERLPVMALPAWRHNRTQPVDGRDMLAFLVAAGLSDAVDGPLSLDVAGPDLVSYGELMERIQDAMLIDRPSIGLGFSLTPVASVVAAAIAGEDPGLIGPLMGSLEHDLLPRDMRAADLLGVRLHSLDAAIERALRDWEAVEELAAR
jgi:uncharacterized protein YbjT (DUF2867 family)